MARSRKVLDGKSSLSIGMGVLLFAGCSTPSYTYERQNFDHPSSAPSSSHPHRASDVDEYEKIQTLSAQHRYEAAENKIQFFEKNYPESSYLPNVQNIYGLILLKEKKAAQAAYHFRRALRDGSQHAVFNQYILFNLATAEHDAHQYDQALQTLSEIHLSQLDAENQRKVHFLRATLNQKKGLPAEACREILMAGRLIPNFERQTHPLPFYQALDSYLKEVNDPALLGNLYQEFEDSPLSDAVLFRLGSREMATGTRTGETHLKSLIQKFPDSLYYARASDLLNKTAVADDADSYTIGVLLPMKGKFAKFGVRSLQGILLAFGIFDSSDPNSKLSLVLEDSGEDSGQAIRALDRLVTQHHVVAVLGPMLSKGIDAVSQRAHDLGVPLLSLSRRAAPLQEFVFQAGLTQQLQAYGIAKYAIEQLGAKRFALVCPSDKFGSEMTQSFWDAVESLGGKVTAYERYSPGETDFRQVVDKLSGLYYTEARQRELNLLAEEREANHITKKTRKTERFYQLKPIVDYDAVFIPDEPKVAGQIIPTFFYRDIEHVQFLGTSAWNSPEFIARTQNYGEKAFFLDAYSPESSSLTMKNFSSRFKSQFGQDPSSFEALAYDAASLVRYTLTSGSHGLSRSEAKDKLKEIQNFQGVTGAISFKDGQFFRNLQALTVRSGRFVEPSLND